ncbi:MAG: DNA-3-methyladenine glycosylase 2 family protein [bacterium]|nr:DNA-3-methyladenine glycosylase 2 family protein [bacterium]
MYQRVKNYFRRTDPKLFKVLEEVGKLEEIKPISSREYFSHLCREIIGQQLSGKVVRIFLERFKNLFPKKHITPKFLSKLPDKKLRSIGVSWAKARYLKDLACKVENKEIALASLQRLGDEKVVEELVKIKGIGNWTAEMFLMFSLGREDVFSHGDLGLRKAIEKIYNLKNPTKSSIEQLSRKWRPYRTWACRILWSSRDNK